MISSRLKNKIKNNLLIFALNLIRFFQKKSNFFDEKRPKVLLVTTTALGDTLWATPAIEAIRKKYPGGYLACLCSFQAKTILEKNIHLNKIFLLKEPFVHHFISLFKLLKKEKFQAVIILHSSQRLTLPLCYLLNPSILAATEGLNKGLDSLLTHSFPNKASHEIDRRFEIIKCLKVAKTTDKMSFYFEEDKEFIRSEINGSPLIIFHPGAKDLFRAWGAASYSPLGQKLCNTFNATIAITGSKEEEGLVTSIAKNIPKSKSYAGLLNLNQLATLYKHADLVITGDTGPLHLSLALGTKTIALFAPTDPKRFGPLNTPHGWIIKKSQTCVPCRERKCPNPLCFLQITPEEVFNLCQTILK
jgi:ADP-heptose:LPS heptosyltransferase